MSNIGVISYGTSEDSPYIEVLKKKNVSLIEIDDELVNVFDSSLEAIVLDCCDKSSEDIRIKICEILLKIQIEQIRFIFVILKDSKKIDRMIFLQLGASGVFDEITEPDEFSYILTNVLNKRNNLILPTVVKEEEVENMLKLIPNNRSICLEDGIEIPLTGLEFKLLDYLKRRGNEVATYKNIAEAVWGSDIPIEKTRIANLVHLIRTKIEENPIKPDYIKNVRGLGYILSKKLG
ncbi:hypothetical protein DOK67_0001094 [Enterococcus sp. DIV0212c]|uniref:winged helix-turn-helix domain-containing protein n=1 Tax=Enterococcus sp. DIV0212c TaxID=2230867 RepID=UPI001A9C16F6|nr:winged helix-turn-helix domain-containing protein [Enterococcus sp. DIV0212c]MBO1354452.1 response regulator transcription factor [Enterococcus sp. DIV0212c]